VSERQLRLPFLLPELYSKYCFMANCAFLGRKLRMKRHLMACLGLVASISALLRMRSRRRWWCAASAQLAKLSCAGARPLMAAAIKRLKAQAQLVNAQLHMP